MGRFWVRRVDGWVGFGWEGRWMGRFWVTRVDEWVGFGLGG